MSSENANIITIEKMIGGKAVLIRRLRELREDHDMRQQDVADYLHCTQVCYSRYENGERELPIEYLIKLAELYRVSADYILDIEQKTRPPRR